MKRNIVNPEAIAPAVGAVVKEYGLHDGPLASAVEAATRRAVLLQDEGFHRVRKRRPRDPDWVEERLGEGVPLHRFRRVDLAVEALLCELADTLPVLAALAGEAEPDLLSATARAKRCVARIDRYALHALAREAERIARAAQSERFARDERKPLAPREKIAGTQGREWRRVRTLAHLDRIGRRYRNCLSRARGEHYRAYWQRALDGELAFWALFPPAGGDAGGRRSVLLASVDPETDTLDEVEGVRTRHPSPLYREDVLRLMRELGLEGDWTMPAADMGLVPEMVAGPVAPSAQGRIKGRAWRVFRFERSLVVERDGAAGDRAAEGAACAVIDLASCEKPTRLADVHAGGLLEGKPLARILARYARRVPVIDPVLGRVLALALREIA